MKVISAPSPFSKLRVRLLTPFALALVCLLAPGAAIFITVLAFNFLGDGLRDALDTK